MNLFFVLFFSFPWTPVQALFAKRSPLGIRPWMHYLLAPHHFRLQRQTAIKTSSLIGALMDFCVITKRPTNRCKYISLTFKTTAASAQISEKHKYAAVLQQYIVKPANTMPTLISGYGTKRRAGYLCYRQHYATREPLPHFRPTQAINSLCGSVDILTFHRASIAGYYKVRLSVPKPLGINISVLHYSSHYESWGCPYDRVTIGYFQKNSNIFLTCFHFCGLSQKQNVLLPTSTADVHLHYQKFSQDSHLRLQFQGSDMPSEEERTNDPTLFTGEDKTRI